MVPLGMPIMLLAKHYTFLSHSPGGGTAVADNASLVVDFQHLFLQILNLKHFSVFTAPCFIISANNNK